MSIDVFPATVLNSTLWNGQTYEEGTFTVTATGFTTVVTGTAYYVRVGKQVTLFVPLLTGTSNATTFTLTGLPVALQSLQSMEIPVFVYNNSAALQPPGLLAVAGASSTWTVFSSNGGGGWTASGTKRLSATTISYVQL